MDRYKFSKSQIEKISLKQKNKCAMCKTPLEKGRYHIEHVIGLFKGGEDDSKNIQLLCVRCHKKKTADEGIGFARDGKEPYIKVCKYCGKVLEGFTEKQTEYMYKQHLISKHPDKIKISEVKHETKLKKTDK